VTSGHTDVGNYFLGSGAEQLRAATISQARATNCSKAT
jgi:hypothetical protein